MVIQMAFTDKKLVSKKLRKKQIAAVKDEQEGAKSYAELRQLSLQEGRPQDAVVYEKHRQDEIRHGQEDAAIVDKEQNLFQPRGPAPSNWRETLDWWKKNPEAIPGFLDAKEESVADYINNVVHPRGMPVSNVTAINELLDDKNELYAFLDAHSESALSFIQDVYYQG